MPTSPPEVDPFSEGAVAPETKQLNDLVEQTLATVPAVHERPVAETRAEREAGNGPLPLQLLPDAVEREIPGPSGPLRVRQFTAPEPRCAFLHIHGGGWVLGAAHHQDPLLKRIADGCNAAVLSIDYRLAPESTYPAAPDDCEAAACWMLEHAQREFGTDNLLIGGESAGAHLSVVTLLRMRDKHGFTGFRGANLVFGCYDFTMTPSLANWGERNLVLNTPITEWFFDQFVPDRERRRDPDVSPLYADLHDMPPALFTVGTLDPLLDDSLFMHERWRAAGNSSELHVSPGGIHGFTAFPTPAAETANGGIIDFLNRCVDGEAN